MAVRNMNPMTMGMKMKTVKVLQVSVLHSIQKLLPLLLDLQPILYLMVHLSQMVELVQLLQTSLRMLLLQQLHWEELLKLELT